MPEKQDPMRRKPLSCNKRGMPVGMPHTCNGGNMVHSFHQDGTYMAVDVNSGAVHVLDETAYRVLALLDATGSPADPDALATLRAALPAGAVDVAMAELAQLKADGLLFTDDPYRGMLPNWNKSTVVKALCLHIAHDCNLRCAYCFAGTGEYMGHRSMMSLEVGKKAIDFLIAASGNRKNLEVDFFGGEPLMNFDTVKGIVAYARGREAETGKNFRFTLTTNAVLLDEEKMKWADEVMHNIVLSIDGRPEVNDAMRKRVDGSGSYDRILPNIRRMVALRGEKSYYVRGTFTRANLDFADDVLHLARLGFDQVSVEPVVANKGSGLDIREEDLDRCRAEYERLARLMAERIRNGTSFNFFHFMIDLEGGPCVAKRLRGCGSGTEYMAVTPEGELYPCHQFVGQPEFRLGDVFDGLVETPVRQEFLETTVYTKPACDACWAKFYCAGGCAANAWQFNKDIKKPYTIGCELEKKRVECALWVKAQELEEAGAEEEA